MRARMDTMMVPCWLRVNLPLTVKFSRAAHASYPVACRPLWTVEPIPGGDVVKDASGQALAYCYARETKADADNAKVLTS